MKQEPNYSVYWMRCPKTRVVKYIGISMRPKHRLKWHLKSGYPHTASQRWVVSLREQGLKPIQEVVLNGLTLKQAERVEARLLYLHSTVYPFRLQQSHGVAKGKRHKFRDSLPCS